MDDVLKTIALTVASSGLVGGIILMVLNFVKKWGEGVSETLSEMAKEQVRQGTTLEHVKGDIRDIKSRVSVQERVCGKIHPQDYTQTKKKVIEDL